MKKFYVYAMGALILPFLASCGDDKEDSGYTGSESDLFVG